MKICNNLSFCAFLLTAKREPRREQIATGPDRPTPFLTCCDFVDTDKINISGKLLRICTRICGAYVSAGDSVLASYDAASKLWYCCKTRVLRTHTRCAVWMMSRCKAQNNSLYNKEQGVVTPIGPVLTTATAVKRSRVEFRPVLVNGKACWSQS